MASPQIENGYIKIANELMEAFLAYEFTKRQHNIINFIVRLSYGFNRKNAYIPRLCFFQTCGVNKVDIKKELEYLEAANVIQWNRDYSLFAINKDHEKWEIKRKRHFCKDILDELYFMQLQPKDSSAISKRDKKVSKTLTNRKKEVSKTLTNESKKVSKTLTEKSTNKYFTNRKVSKTLTYKLVKHEHGKRSNPRQQRPGSPSKYIIKNNNKDNTINSVKAEALKIKDNNGRAAHDTAGQVYKFFDENIKRLNPFYAERVGDWLDDSGPELLMHVFKHALESSQATGTPPIKFIDKIIVRMKERGIKTIADFEAAEKKRQRSREPARKEILPDWMENKEKPPEPTEWTDKELEEKEALERELAQFKNN